MKQFLLFNLLVLGGLLSASTYAETENASGNRTLETAESGFRSIPIQSRISGVQPMTGIAMWQGSRNSHTDAIQLEFSYMRYSDVVEEKGTYD
ncbi:hypothetical protein OAG77_00380 [bacterium]|nr:hypothetical protein [bacterium]